MTTRKSIFITGAASGIGRETALYFAGKGWFVGITDVNREGLESLEQQIGKENCYRSELNVVDTEATKTVMAEFGKRTGDTMHLLFNNAGIVKFGRFEEVDLAINLKMVDINLKGVLICTHSALPMLKNTPGSRVVTMSSTSNVYGIPDLSVYSAIKRGVLAITEALDIELEKYGITVSDITVPYVNTPFLEVDEEVFSIKKMGIKTQPLEVAKTVFKAAQKKKLHWKINPATYALTFIFWLLPFVKRPIIKMLTVAPE